MAARPCDECKTYLYDAAGEPVLRGGKPVRRPPGSPLPCANCPKIPPGTPPLPENAVELTEEHRETVRFYRECRAVGQFPADPIVRWAAATLRAAEDHCDRVQATRTQLTVLTALKGG